MIRLINKIIVVRHLRRPIQRSRRKDSYRVRVFIRMRLIRMRARIEMGALIAMGALAGRRALNH